jgi:hypothetical protein
MTPRSWADLFTRNGDGHAGPDPALVSRLLGPVVNAVTAPFTRLRALMDPRRDIEAECGYPSLTEAVPVELYHQLYTRDAVAARVVEVYPEESWQVTPSVYEDEDAEEATPFEAAWDALGAGLYEDPECCYAEEEGSPVWEALKCADVLSGVGRHGVLVLGLSDGKDLSQPVAPAPGLKLTFLTPLPEHLALITATDPRKNSRRYGLPTQYAVTLGDPAEQYGAVLSAGPASSTSTVHWSRVVHVADVGHQAPTSRVYAVPRMRPVLNQLLGLHKLYACAPEMFWLAALPMLKFVTHAQLGGDVDVDLGELKGALEQARNSLQRMVLGRGGDWGTVGPAVSDPASQIAVQLEAVCIKLGCPVRVFKGSERGELASSQDDQAWNDRLKARQARYVTPRIIVPFVQRLISLGVLPKPARFKVWWPDLTSVSDGQKADVAAKKTTALAQYVGGNVESLVAPTDYLTRFLDFTEEEAQAILDNAGGAVPSGDGTDLAQEPYTQPEEQQPAEPAPAAQPDQQQTLAAASAQVVNARGLTAEERREMLERYHAGEAG